MGHDVLSKPLHRLKTLLMIYCVVIKGQDHVPKVNGILHLLDSTQAVVGVAEDANLFEEQIVCDLLFREEKKVTDD